MFTINVSFYTENMKDSAISFAAHMMAMGHRCLSTNSEADKESSKQGVVDMLFSVKKPTEVFVLLEQYASESIPVPEQLKDIYFSEVVYSIHTTPKDIDFVQMVELINHNINFGCILRRDNYRLRNMFLEEDKQELPSMNPATSAAFITAINILSKKILGTELLESVNKKEEVKWPLH